MLVSGGFLYVPITVFFVFLQFLMVFRMLPSFVFHFVGFLPGAAGPTLFRKNQLEGGTAKPIWAV